VGHLGDLEVSTEGTSPGRGGDAARVLTIDLEELTWALNSRDPLGESGHWLNLESGVILSLMDPMPTTKPTGIYGRMTAGCSSNPSSRPKPSA
jgi:hypothetical protein